MVVLKDSKFITKPKPNLKRVMGHKLTVKCLIFTQIQSTLS